MDAAILSTTTKTRAENFRKIDDPIIAPLVIDTIDRFESNRQWTFSSKINALAALRRTNKSLCQEASAPRLRTWQEGVTKRNRDPISAQAAGRGQHRYTLTARNSFFDRIVGQMSKLEHPPLKLLSYLSAHPSPPGHLVTMMNMGIAFCLGRWPALSTLEITDQEGGNEGWDDSVYDFSYLRPLLRLLNLKELNVMALDRDCSFLCEEIVSDSLLILSCHQASFLDTAGLQASAPNLRELTVLVDLDEESYDMAKLAPELATLRIDSVTLRCFERLDSTVRSKNANSFVFPAFASGQIKRLTLQGFPPSWLDHTIARRPACFAHIGEVFIEPHEYAPRG